VVPVSPGDAQGLGLERAILHVDMDAFFAAVEVLDNPELAGLPVIVGGTGGRGVVASCTYEARAYGVRSAMPSVRARQLCPDAVFVDGHYSRYSEVSQSLHQIFHATTPLVEPIGLDEAFLDVTGARRLLGSPHAIAVSLREQVQRELGITCSVGIGRSKLIAKLASKKAKPRADRRGMQPGPGVLLIDEEGEAAFLAALPIEALWGVGPATAARLHALGVRTVGELAEMPESALVSRLGRAGGTHLAELARGHDPRPVEPDRGAKSIGHEETFPLDLDTMGELQHKLVRMAESVALHLRQASLGGKTVTVKVRFGDFSTITRSHTLPTAVDTAPAIGAVAGALLDGVDVSPGVRLLGVSVGGLAPGDPATQLSFDLAAAPAAAESQEDAAAIQESWHEVTAAIDAIRLRFGRAAVGTAAMVGNDRLEVPTQRQAPWGPNDDDGIGRAAPPG